MRDNIDARTIDECLYCIGHIMEYTEGIHSIGSLLNDHKTYDAVLMNFVVIGECANRLSETAKQKCPSVDWRAVIGFRNFVAHQYFGLDMDLVWSTIRHDLPHLEASLIELKSTL